MTLSVVAVLRRLGFTDIYITGRNLESAARRAEELSCRLFDPSSTGVDARIAMTAAPMPAFDLFVNAAPVTDSPLSEAGNLLAALGVLAPGGLVFDHEMPGAYLRDYCEGTGLRHLPGSSMYRPQMYAQWRLFLTALLGTEVTEGDVAGWLDQAEEMSTSD